MNKDFQELKLQSKLVYSIGKIPSTLDFEFHFNFSLGSLKKHTHTNTINDSVFQIQYGHINYRDYQFDSTVNNPSWTAIMQRNEKKYALILHQRCLKFTIYEYEMFRWLNEWTFRSIQRWCLLFLMIPCQFPFASFFSH